MYYSELDFSYSRVGRTDKKSRFLFVFFWKPAKTTERIFRDTPLRPRRKSKYFPRELYVFSVRNENGALPIVDGDVCANGHEDTTMVAPRGE